MFSQLEKLEKRYIEIEQLLGSQDAFTDMAQYGKLVKELSDLKGVVVLFREYKKVAKETEDLETELSSETQDEEFLELIRKELRELVSKKADLEEKLKKTLSGEDKDLGRDVIV
ncbi:MAG: PCRF domain-containing protein, partial [Candidatus Omnitrophota bacterium]